MTCEMCNDPKAVLKDGLCSCPEGQKMDGDGMCHSCEVKGCDECQVGSNINCTKCIDSSADLKNGICTCPQSNHTLNFFGYCSYCFAKGCAECTWSATECHTCKDPEEATLVDG